MGCVGVALSADPTHGPVMCCLPPKWQANIIDLKSKAGLSSVIVFAHDEINMMEGYYVVALGSSLPMVQRFVDYKTNTTYSVDMSGGDPTAYKCVKGVNDRPFYGGCNSTTSMGAVKNMRYIGESTIGPPGKAITFDAWSYSYFDTDITITLSRDGNCVPLLENVSSNSAFNGAPFDSLLMFEKVSTTVSNQELLTIPAACASAFPDG